MDTACPCHVCQAEGQHDPWCSAHLADYEHLAVPPCDCGLREGTRRTPALTPVVTCTCCDRQVDELVTATRRDGTLQPVCPACRDLIVDGKGWDEVRASVRLRPTEA